MSVKGNPNFKRKIKDLKVGETGYVTPWTLMFDNDHVPFLYIDRPFEEEPQGTASMPVKRTGPGKTDFEVDMDFDYSGDNYEWSETDDPYSAINGADESDIVRLGDEESTPNGKIQKSYDSDLFKKVEVGNTDITISHN